MKAPASGLEVAAGAPDPKGSGDCGPPAPVCAAMRRGQLAQLLHAIVKLVYERQFNSADGNLPADTSIVGPAIDRLGWCC